ncbi:hypothetical protein ALP68_01609 [Pseudomonas ficuserectae]|uniref:Uncharacterized protein n=1 Tax=Pseudomonas amygdali pv. eriobotryae TaxID=129137 RepID=A0A9P3AG94_PSEA0|nr:MULTISPECIES: hypothetical protein [Pseudomonas syringae group genomosp. 2]RMS39301.1 hypothetical protein ALP68_01609 [Pseudomonas ficuserectae]RMS39364.1 hypothetical protein ALP67_03070 [Pseudomonas ficuserectae]GFZ62143.1 hypothetical protein PSE10A_46540 [Pseudomonas amygdali pv. eriobotryae]
MNTPTRVLLKDLANLKYAYNTQIEDWSTWNDEACEYENETWNEKNYAGGYIELIHGSRRDDIHFTIRFQWNAHRDEETEEIFVAPENGTLMHTTFEYDREKLEIYDEEFQLDISDYLENVALFLNTAQASSIQEILSLSNWEDEIKEELKGHS